jgi:hypothetical protein
MIKIEWLIPLKDELQQISDTLRIKLISVSYKDVSKVIKDSFSQFGH